jgi:AAA domain
MSANFPPPRWVVPSLLPEGLTILAGPPKVGKSWLSIGLAVAVAAGGRALSSIAVEAGSVLYLALEDTGRRLQSRLAKILSGDAPPPGLTFAIESPTMRAGGLERVDSWLSASRGRLVIIDVLQRFRGPALQGQSAYAADYEAITQIKLLADLHQCGIIVVHHDRKGNAEDFISEISGTYGLAGGADTICALKRSRGDMDGVLHITGRDVEENELALQFAPAAGSWSLIGLASEYGLSESRRKILAYLRLHEGAKPAEIALGIGLARELVKQTVLRMADDQQLDSDGHGHYFVPLQPDGALYVTTVTVPA